MIKLAYLTHPQPASFINVSPVLLYENQLLVLVGQNRLLS
jgi:hypothetical protein